jgi:hypothetical protein
MHLLAVAAHEEEPARAGAKDYEEADGRDDELQLALLAGAASPSAPSACSFSAIARPLQKRCERDVPARPYRRDTNAPAHTRSLHLQR